MPWERLVVVPANGNARTQPVLAGARWPDDDALARFADKVLHDPRYQGVVLLENDRVVAAELFFTFWADLSALARPEGFAREEAVFTARVANNAYVLSVPEQVPQDACN